MGRFFATLFFALPLHAFMIGNPAQPTLLDASVVYNFSHNISFRAAYLDDYVYNQHVKNEFEFGPSNEKPPLLRFSTEAALLTLNLFQRLDLYGIVGSSKMQMDHEIYTKRELAWGFGGKLIFLSWDCFRLGCDLKYFQSDQHPLYLVVTGVPFNIVSDWEIRYREYQAALGASYQAGWICPYIHLTYITTKLEPHPYTFLVNVPGVDEPVDATIQSFDGRHRWGMAVGATLIAGSKSTLALESRFFNQNGIDASIEFRF
jgi:hypothetical protein